MPRQYSRSALAKFVADGHDPSSASREFGYSLKFIEDEQKTREYRKLLDYYLKQRKQSDTRREKRIADEAAERAVDGIEEYEPGFSGSLNPFPNYMQGRTYGPMEGIGKYALNPFPDYMDDRFYGYMLGFQPNPDPEPIIPSDISLVEKVNLGYIARSDLATRIFEEGFDYYTGSEPGKRFEYHWYTSLADWQSNTPETDITLIPNVIEIIPATPVQTQGKHKGIIRFRLNENIGNNFNFLFDINVI